MDIRITGRKMKVTSALHDHVINKLEEATKVFDIESMNADVTLRVENYKGEKHNERCEIVLHVRGYVIRVECGKEDLYAAIDEACRMVTRQLRKYKTKVIDKRARKKGPFDDITDNATQLENQVLADERLLKEDDDALVRTKYIEFTKMPEENALVQIDLLNHDFFVFTDADTGNVHVVYRRKNGGYGILKPDSEEN